MGLSCGFVYLVFLVSLILGQDEPQSVIELLRDREGRLEYGLLRLESLFLQTAPICPSYWDTCLSTIPNGILLSPDSSFSGISTSRNVSSTYVPPEHTQMISGDNGVDKEVRLIQEGCVHDTMALYWKAILQELPDTKWQYFGGQHWGSFTSFPGTHWASDSSLNDCQNYDPRFRPWYAAAASGPKDVIIVIDSSGSMSGDPMALAKKAANAVLLTMTHFDFVAVVDFDSSASASGSSLIRANAQGRSQLSSFVNSLDAEGGTDFSDALEKAYEILRSSRKGTSTSNCDSPAILFLSDGQGGDPTSVMEDNEDLNARIFSFALGEGADECWLQKMSCLSNGLYHHVEIDGPLDTIMASYYQIYASGIQTSKVRWSEIYHDGLGLGEVISGAIAVFDRSQDSPDLVGVIAIDITLSELMTFGDNRDEIETLLLAESSQCFPLNLTKDHLASMWSEEYPCNNELNCACFPGDATVTMADGSLKLMKQVAVGDEIMSVDPTTMEVKYSAVFHIPSADPSSVISYVFIDWSDGEDWGTFRLTPDHLVFVKRNALSETIRGKEVKVGDKLVAVNHSSLKVAEVKEVRLKADIGNFAPLTMEGTVVVDGIVASSYSRYHSLGSLIFLPHKILYSIFGDFLTSSEEFTKWSWSLWLNPIFWFERLGGPWIVQGLEGLTSAITDSLLHL